MTDVEFGELANDLSIFCSRASNKHYDQSTGQTTLIFRSESEVPMRSHYPILSLIVAIVALAIPAILVAWPSKPQPDEAAAAAADADLLRVELRELSQSLAELHTRLDELEERPTMPSPSPVAVTPLLPTTAPSPLTSAPLPPTSDAQQPLAPSRVSEHGAAPVTGSPVTNALVDHSDSRDEPTDRAEPEKPLRSFAETTNVTESPRLSKSIAFPFSDALSMETLQTPVGTSSSSDASDPLSMDEETFDNPSRPHGTTETPAAVSPPSQTRDEVALRPTTKSPTTRRKPNVRTTNTRRTESSPRTSSRDSRVGNASPLDAMSLDAMSLDPGSLEMSALDSNMLEVNTLDEWDDQPYFPLSIARPASGMVHHWEEFVATTNVPGWPVVMVRSETEGDDWWVQQLVARRGNVIAAKVSFGNEQTVSGHEFEVVILLLDSSAESVRFRTARKFKKLPEGVQRSVVYRYVRR